MRRMVKLPQELGAATVEVLATATPVTLRGEPVEVVDVPEVGLIAVPKMKLAEALPPEPEDGTVLRVRYRAGHTAVIERDDAATASDGTWRWYSTDIADPPHRWEDVAAGAESMTRLAPAPELVGLPWRGLGCEVSVVGPVVFDRAHDIDKGSTISIGMRPHKARQKAYALLAAADKAEATGRD